MKNGENKECTCFKKIRAMHKIYELLIIPVSRIHSIDAGSYCIVVRSKNGCIPDAGLERVANGQDLCTIFFYRKYNGPA